jgi:hypothetical protein
MEERREKDYALVVTMNDRQEWLQDPKILCLIQKLQDHSLVSPGYSWHNDILFKLC